MRTIAVALLVAVVVIGCGNPEPAPDQSEPAAAASTVCDDPTARLVARVYYIANPIMEQTEPRKIEQFVAANASLLSDASGFARCATRAGTRFISEGLAAFNPGEADAAYGRVLEMGGSASDADAVRKSLTAPSLDLVQYGRELLWYSQVIPSAAAGDWTPFRTVPATEARQAIRQVWPMIASFADPSDIAIVRDAFAASQPWIEYQVVLLVARVQ